MKDVFKELKVLVVKGKVSLHKLTKIYWKQYLHEQLRFSSTILVTILELILEPRLVWIAIFYSLSSTLSSISFQIGRAHV